MGVDTNVEALTKIKTSLCNLQSCLSKGFSSSQKNLIETEQKVDELINITKERLVKFNEKIEESKRAYLRAKEEQERAQRESQNSSGENSNNANNTRTYASTNTMNSYNGPSLEDINRMEKQRDELSEQIKTLIFIRNMFGDDGIFYLQTFNKLLSSSTGGESNERMQMRLSKLIERLEEYLRINISSNIDTPTIISPQTVLTQFRHSTITEVHGSADAISFDSNPTSNIESGGGTQNSTPINSISSLQQTQQEWHTDSEGHRVFDSPQETGAMLNSRQGITPEHGGEGVEGFKGTCGLVSCENVLRMAGVNVTEAQVVNYARTHRVGGLISRRTLCTINSTPEQNGSTYWQDRQAILSHFGVESDLQHVNTRQLAEHVESGRGVIACVDATVLWYGRNGNPPEYHAVTVTSVRRDPTNNQIEGFFICDSGFYSNDGGARFVPVNVMSQAMRVTNGEINVTRNIIR